MALTNEEVLAKLRKSAHSSLSYKAMAAALAPVGWTVEVHKKGLNSPVRNAFDFARKEVITALAEMAGVDDEGAYASYTYDGDELPVHGDKAALDAIAAIAPGSKVGDFTFVKSAGFIEGRDEEVILKVVVEYTGPGVRFVSPRGEEVRCHGSKVATYKVMPLAEKLGLVKDVSTFLGLPTPEEEKADKATLIDRGDVTNCGTCPCCFGMYKMTADKKMVHHGYQRPGCGSIFGDCFGVGYAPFEISNEGTIAYIEALKQSNERMEKGIAFLNSAECVSLDKTLEKRGKIEIVTYVAGTPEFEKLRLVKIKELNGNIKSNETHIKFLEKANTDWKPSDLPEVRVARGERLRRVA
jgi:hypothetical protein